MSERYDSAAAAHYSAYRPPLHSLILAKVFARGESATVGLDVGCGTGHSAIALARYCTETYAFDVSPLMLARAAKDERVTYLAAAVERLPIQSSSVDLVTFAGSLFYADRVATGEEIRRVCARDAWVIVYDFEVLLDDFLLRLGIEPKSAGSKYDHTANFSGERGFAEVVVKSERLTIELSALELTHVLLSDSNRLDRLVDKHGTSDPSALIEANLRAEGDRLSVGADIYYSTYRVNGDADTTEGFGS